ncbi:protein kinase [Synechococcus sp. CS-603]|nr:protein kinase [Synechococcus sp. CS-603]
MDSMASAAPGMVIAERYRLEAELGDGTQGKLWRASDQLAAEAPIVLRQLGPDQDQPRLQELWAQLRGVLHPQVPRFGEVISRDGDLWLVREWQGGRTYRELIEARRERQLVFGNGEVMLLLRQLLPVLAVLHGQELVHGDLCPANLLRRDRDGLPVLLDFGLTTGLGNDSRAATGATPGYAPPELGRGAPAAAWMDLYSLGVVALVLLSGEEPAGLLDPASLSWRWPSGLALDPPFQAAIERLISADPARRFSSAGNALEAFQQLPMPESTGPVPRADRTVVLVPPPAAASPAQQIQLPQTQPAAAEPTPSPQPVPPVLARSRQQNKEEAVEGRLWPLVVTLALSAVVGISLGWWLLGRSSAPSDTQAEVPLQQLPSSLPPAEVDQRQQLLNRLRALQVNRGWFLKLVDSSLLAQFPERGGRLPGDGLEDAPLRRVWNELAEDWLVRVETLPLSLRSRLGGFSAGDWEAQQQRLAGQGLSPPVLRQLVSGNAQNLLPGRAGKDIPPEPQRQLWYAAAQQTLENLRIESIEVAPEQARIVSARIQAGGARVFPIRVPKGYRLSLGVNGSPLMQMSVYDSNGTQLEPKGPLRRITVERVEDSQVQVLVSNDGVAAASISLTLQVEAPPPEPPPEPRPEPALTEPDAPGLPLVPRTPTAPNQPIRPGGEAEQQPSRPANPPPAPPRPIAPPAPPP